MLLPLFYPRLLSASLENLSLDQPTPPLTCIWIMCRGTLVEQGPTHPVESWDFQAGDIWYFPSNVGHAILGLNQGCNFIAVYNSGSFDEAVNSRGISNWLATAPPEIVAQVQVASSAFPLASRQGAELSLCCLRKQ